MQLADERCEWTARFWRCHIRSLMHARSTLLTRLYTRNQDMRSQILMSALLSSTVTGSQVANFNISAITAAQYGCNATCYESFSAGLAEDFAEFGSLYNEGFYATAKNFTKSVPGDILKFEPINPEDFSGSLPKGITAYRFQYTSANLSNNTVPVTGFVAFPYANTTNGNLYRTASITRQVVRILDNLWEH